MNNLNLKLVLISIVIAGLSIEQGYAQIEMRERPIDEKGFTEYIQYLVDVAEPRTTEERAKDIEMMNKYKEALVVDALFVGGPGFPAGFTEEQYEKATQHSIDNQYDFISATYTNGPLEDKAEVVMERM